MKSTLQLLFCYLCSLCSTAISSEAVVSVESDTGQLEGTLLEAGEKNSGAVALIIAGSGPTDRNGNNPRITNNSLKMLAEELSDKGISSLRYDKRGVGQSHVSGINESDLRFEHYISDADRWIAYLSGSGKFDQLVVIGHSEGSLIGMVASQNTAVDKFISIAGAGQSVDQLLRQQLEGQPAVVLEQSSDIINKLLQGETVENVPDYLHALFRPSIQPYIISLFKYDPQKEISKLEKPVLIVQGTTDIQVGLIDADNLAVANPSAGKVVIENMNHIFKDAPLDRDANLKTYNDPDLKIKSELIQAISNFVLN